MTTPDEELTPAESEQPPDERRCAQCNARLDPDQYYCLECGWTSEIAPGLAPKRTLGPLLAAGLIALGLVGGGVAFAALQDDDDGGVAAITTDTTTQIEPVPTVPSTTDGGLPPDPAATTITDPTTTDTLPTTEPPVGGEATVPETDFEATTDSVVPPPPTTTAPEPEPEPTSDWPVGQTAWTAIVSSVRSSAEASDTKERVRAAGEPAGLLFSTDHPELRPGFWVVFSGVFDTRDEAANHAREISGQFPGAYVRRISAP